VPESSPVIKLEELPQRWTCWGQCACCAYLPPERGWEDDNHEPFPLVRRARAADNSLDLQFWARDYSPAL
jgi:hypothetical protein